MTAYWLILIIDTYKANTLINQKANIMKTLNNVLTIENFKSFVQGGDFIVHADGRVFCIYTNEMVYSSNLADAIEFANNCNG